MAFWSGETLSNRLSSLKLIEPFQIDRIDCAAYTLRVGPEIFVTSDQNKGDAQDGCKIVLGEGEPFKIPPGQFAFLLTEERVKIPNNALAFISFKTSQKWLGLVNVSGFHVDPGWDGNLMFGVYNAGPGPVHLRRGMPMFLIWYADLDQTTRLTYKSDGEKGAPRIPEKYVNAMSGQVFSPMVLASDLKEVIKELQGVKERFETLRSIGIGLLIAIGGIFLTVVGWIRSDNAAGRTGTPQVQAQPVQSKSSEPVLEPKATATVPDGQPKESLPAPTDVQPPKTDANSSP